MNHITTISMLAELARAALYAEASPLLQALGLDDTQTKQSIEGARYLVEDSSLLEPPYNPNEAAAHSRAVIATASIGFNPSVRDGVDNLLSLADELMVVGADPQGWGWMLDVFGFPFDRLIAAGRLELSNDTVEAIKLAFDQYKRFKEPEPTLEQLDPNWEESKPQLVVLLNMLSRRALLRTARRVRGMLSDSELQVFEEWASRITRKQLRLEF